MPSKILMPALSPTMEAGKLERWLKKEGDKISAGDMIAEIETDKAVIEYEATMEGVLGKILVKDGSENVKINEVIGILLEEGEDKSAIADFEKSLALSNSSAVKPSVQNDVDLVQNKTTSEQKKQTNPTVNNGASVVQKSADLVQKSKPMGVKVFASPLAKRIAKQNGVNLMAIQGSGPRARIIKRDVLNAPAGGSSFVNVTGPLPFTDSKASGMRATIGKRLLESKTQIPHYYMTAECKVDSLLSARVKINEKADGKYKISVNDFIIKALGLALKDMPEVNASYLEGNIIRQYSRSDVSVAVAIDGGLITPIVKGVEVKDIITISNEVKELVAKAKSGKLLAEEYQGGSFSISNLGMFGIKQFNAIINPPQSGILAIGATEKRVIVNGSNMEIASIMTITLSADHRVVDGAVAAQFINKIKSYLEEPIIMFV